MRRILLNIITHGFIFISGFGLGVYTLPILTAPKSPDIQTIQKMSKDAKFQASLTKDLRGSDFLHWGEGTISLTKNHVIHEGRLSPGPDYKLYLVNQFVDHEDAFTPVKSDALYIGDVKTFDGFILNIPNNVDIKNYNTVLVWCEAFSEFITAAKYR